MANNTDMLSNSKSFTPSAASFLEYDLSDTESAIMSAVYSLYQKGYGTFTAEDVSVVMQQQAENSQINELIRDYDIIDAEVTKLSRKHLAVRFRRIYMPEENDIAENVTIRDFALPLIVMCHTIGTTKYIQYELISKPILFTCVELFPNGRKDTVTINGPILDLFG